MVEPHRPQMTIGCMRFACRITKATDKHSVYVIVIASLWQQWLHELTSVLCYTYVAFVVLIEC